MKKIKQIIILTVTSLFFLCCNSSGKDKKDESFTFIEKGSYTINTYNGLAYYRLNKTKEFMDGYYVVGNEMSKWEEFEFKEGLLNGDYIIFHPNGEMFSHTQYSNGKKHGEESMYFPDGVLNSKSTFNNDILTGSKFTYYETGKIQSESKIEDGESVETQHFDLLGNIISQSFIRDGRTITQKIVEGKIYSEMVSSNYDSYETMKFFNEDGSTKIYLQQVVENETMYVLELDENGNEIKRIDLKANPQEAFKYASYFQ
ncbi:hypothetical protein [uncultured Winogradskyella sp.]|uniref:toxin-antitoxin system YwqK family antitoxin n=1 Tax=uncultured Winogradskyella sp. TaxID=395353 RepID=UPI00260779BF|nr:hypothetical protein [uncultured Winogradskyella sp.]|tara:strand:- start:734 stop:1507 length:774 start_codon:yes stop_codon:yes gene_type:complete